MARTFRQQILIGTGITLFAAVLVATAPGMFRDIDRVLLRGEYRIRGETPVDSSIVILYLDNDAISSLGELPLKRTYYASIVDVLRRNGAKAIGIDIAFTEPDLENPEYDDLFVAMVKRAGNVVLSTYFSSTSDVPTPAVSGVASFAYPGFAGQNFPYGLQPSLPFGRLLAGSYGLGHTNYVDEITLPSCIALAGPAGGELLASFPFEVWRASRGLPKEAVRFTSSGLRVKDGKKDFIIPCAGDGDIVINHAGGISSLRMYPLINAM